MKKGIFFFLAASLLIRSAVASANSSNVTNDMVAVIDSLKNEVKMMHQIIDEQGRRIRQLESASTTASALSDEGVQKSFKKTLGEVTPWLKGLKQSGDFRLRMENFEYYDKNNDAGSTGTAADRTRNRFRVRLRWGLEKDFGDDWKTGFRLSTGNTTDPTTANQTLGNSGYFTFKNVLIDRAYASYEPSALKDAGVIQGVKIAAGKTDNPFFRYSTPMTWDADVSPEGVYEQVKLLFFSDQKTKVEFQSTLGQFILNENTGTETDAQLYGYQGALAVTTWAFGTVKPISFASAVSYYDYPNWFQTVTSNTAATSFLRTNSIVADNFRVLDIYPEIGFELWNKPFTLWADYATNLANTGTDDIVQSGGNDIHDADDAWGAGLKIGKVVKKGSWETSYSYYTIGANALVAAFNEAAFGGPGGAGGTNRKGHKLTFGYQVTDNMVLNWTGYVVRPLNPFNGNSTIGIQNSTNETIFRSQLDVVYKF